MALKLGLCSINLCIPKLNLGHMALRLSLTAWHLNYAYVLLTYVTPKLNLGHMAPRLGVNLS
jgi:hypothetical protein